MSKRETGSIAKVKALTAFMRKNGLLQAKMGDIDLSLHPGFLIDPNPTVANKTQPEMDTEDLSDPMKALLWSSPGTIGGDEDVN